MNCLLFVYKRPQCLLYLGSGHYARLPPHRLTLMKQNQCWNTLYAVLLGHGSVTVYVNFNNPQLAAVLGRYLLQNGGHGFAGAAPGGVKVDQHRHTGAIDEFGEGLARHDKGKEKASGE